MRSVLLNDFCCNDFCYNGYYGRDIIQIEIQNRIKQMRDEVIRKMWIDSIKGLTPDELKQVIKNNT